MSLTQQQQQQAATQTPGLPRTVVAPGDALVRAGPRMLAGNGVYLRNSSFYSSILGWPKLEVTSSSSSEPNAESEAPVTVVSVEPCRRPNYAVPKPGSIVVGQVRRVTMKAVSVAAYLVEGAGEAKDPFECTLRLENVREFDTDRVTLSKCFRPGDTVRAMVISLGDSHSFLLSTARNSLGVLYAKCSCQYSGMIPVSWEQMQCPECGNIEPRKVCERTTTNADAATSPATDVTV